MCSSASERNRLDYAQSGQHSPDAAVALGPSFVQTGFSRTWETCGFPSGSYQLFAWVSSLVVEGARNVASVPVEIRPCPPASTILEDEKGWRPDVITMGTAGRRAIERFPLSGFFQLVLGSTAETVARKSRSSVVTLRLRT